MACWLGFGSAPVPSFHQYAVLRCIQAKRAFGFRNSRAWKAGARCGSVALAEARRARRYAGRYRSALLCRSVRAIVLVTGGAGCAA
jgi:hypothetical protein